MSTTKVETPQFGKIRSFFWPIHNFELKKLLPMLFLFFFISFNYSILRGIKDTLVINAAGSPGAEIIPYLKLWFVIPLAIVYMLVFSKLSNTLSRERLFYVSTSPFIIFFAIFAFVLYPLKDIIHFPELTISFLPDGFVAMFRIWSFSLFYVMAELWGSVMLSLMFWGFANAITKVSESKRFYALFGIGANIALIVAGSVTGYFAGIQNTVAAGVDAMQITLNYLTGTFLLASASILGIYWWINRYVLTDSRFYDPTQVKKKKSKPKMSLVDSFKYLGSSKYLLFIAVLVIAYGISINLIEVTWKAQVKNLMVEQHGVAGAQNAYLSFMGDYFKYIGITTIFLMLFVTSNLLRMFGWTFTALVTPVVLAITGLGFFALIIFKDFFSPMVSTLGLSTLGVAVVFGTIQNVVSKAAKYSMFDPTKEMTYIPLDEESKVKGKAAIDVVGGRLGKAGGSLIQQALFLVGPLAVVTPYIAIITFLIIAAWIYSGARLGTEFNKKNEEMEKEAAADLEVSENEATVKKS